MILALPVAAAFGGTAFAATADNASGNASDRGNSAAAQAAAAVKKDDAAGKDNGNAATAGKPADAVAPVVPASRTSGTNANTTDVFFSNLGGPTTGSNGTKYEVVNGRSGSPAVGGGQPSGDVYSPQPYSNADKNNTGANDTSATNQYASTRNGAPSLNGNGGGQQVGQPCAGCVGKADNKNPPGQAPNGTDRNAGYECDRNHGIGRGNPAHTGCTGGTPPPPVCVPTAANDNCGNPPKPPVCVPTAANDNCGNPPKPPVCVPTAANDNCGTPPKVCPNGSAMPASGDIKDCGTPPKVCPNGSAMPASGNIKDCGTPPKVCPNGSAMPASGNIKDCGNPGTTTGGNPPKLCPAAGFIGPMPVGCSIGGDTGNPATGSTPATGANPTTIISNGTAPQPVAAPLTGTVGAAAVGGGAAAPAEGAGAAQPAALPFTGSNASLMSAMALLMLLVGTGLMAATRKPKPARAVV